MKTFQFYTFGKKEVARIRVDKIRAQAGKEQIEYNRSSVVGLGDFLYDNLTTSSLTGLITYMARCHRESEENASGKGEKQ